MGGRGLSPRSLPYPLKPERKQTMSNLFELRCPCCRSEDQIDVQAKVWVRLTESGSDADVSGCGDHHYSPESAATRDACGYAGCLRDFEPERADAPGFIPFRPVLSENLYRTKQKA